MLEMVLSQRLSRPLQGPLVEQHRLLMKKPHLQSQVFRINNLFATRISLVR